MRIETRSYKNINFVLTYPDSFSEIKKYPIIIFLHGAGTRGNDIDKVVENPFYRIIEKYENFDFITAAPQCSSDTWFDIFGDLIDFTNYIINFNSVDKERIYGIGASMGGYGIWQLAMSRPEWFAAIVPICGGGMYWNAARLKNVPIWAFHGDNDTVVDKIESMKMTEAVNRAGGNARLTIYQNCGHDAWTKTYSNTEVFKWLQYQKRIDCIANKTEFSDSIIYG